MQSIRTIKHDRRALRFLVAILLFAASNLAIFVRTEPHKTEASSGQCVAALLQTGATVIATAAAPPVGIIKILGVGASMFGLTTSLSACQTHWMKSYIKQYWAAFYGCGATIIYEGTRWDQLMHPYVVFGGAKPASGTGSGGGGGCSGSW